MKKFAASLLTVVLATFVTLFGTVAPAQATVDTLTVAKVPSAIAGGVNATDVVITTNTGASLSSITSGALRVSLQNITLVNSASCTGVTLGVSSASCTVNTIAGMQQLEYLGVDFSTLPSLQIVFGNGTLTLPNTGSAYFNIDQAAGNNQPSLAAGSVVYVMGQQQQQQSNVSLTYGSATHTPATSVSGLANGDNFPGYSVAFTGVGGGTYDSINFLVGDPMNNRFYTVPGATGNSDQSMTTWSPSSCGVTSITRGAAPLSASSGVTCGKMTVTSNGTTQYWVRIKFLTASADDVSFTVAPGTFVVTNQSSTDQFATFLLRNDSGTNTNYSARKFDLLNAVSGVGSSGVAETTIALPTAIGQPVAGQTVGINATNLALNTNYSIVLRSTPQILEQGTTSATFMNTTVTIPAGLEPGWHSITFSAVRSDGAATEQVAYFKISASGLLLQTSTEVPAELAFTAAPQPVQWTLGAILAMLGIGLIAAVYTYRRRVFEMVYVLTGTGGQYDIELVEQPKNARYLPMRSLKK